MKARIAYRIRVMLWNARARRMIRAQREQEDREAKAAQRMEWERRLR